MAIAVHPRESYVLVKADNGEQYILAEALTEKVMKAGGIVYHGRGPVPQGDAAGRI